LAERGFAVALVGGIAPLASGFGAFATGLVATLAEVPASARGGFAGVAVAALAIAGPAGPDFAAVVFEAPDLAAPDFAAPGLVRLGLAAVTALACAAFGARVGLLAEDFGVAFGSGFTGAERTVAAGFAARDAEALGLAGGADLRAGATAFAWALGGRAPVPVPDRLLEAFARAGGFISQQPYSGAHCVDRKPGTSCPTWRDRTARRTRHFAEPRTDAERHMGMRTPICQFSLLPSL
jgi:hypothetical protein